VRRSFAGKIGKENLVGMWARNVERRTGLIDDGARLIDHHRLTADVPISIPMYMA
jgi:hypothetical protein